MKEPLVSVIIVGFNAKRFLKDCFDSLSKVLYKNKEILFVDNGSTDNSSEFVKTSYPFVKIIKNKKNLGFSGGHDVALKAAKGDGILLLNTDTIVQKNLLKELVSVLYRDISVGAVQPKLIIYPEKDQIDSIGAFFSFSGYLYHFGREKDPNLSLYNKPMEIFSGKAACMLIKKEVIEKVGLFDKDYFTAFEDTDFSHRIWLSGYKVIYVPSTYVYHKGGGTTNKMAKAFVVFHGEKNRICSYIKNLSIKYLIRVLPLTIFMSQLLFLEYLIKRKNISAAVSIQKAIFWNVLHIKDTLRKRKIIQNKIRKIGDDEFLPKLIKPVRLSYFYYLATGLKDYKD